MTRPEKSIIYITFYEKTYNGTSTFLTQLKSALRESSEISLLVIELSAPVKVIEEIKEEEHGDRLLRMPYGADEAFDQLNRQGIIIDSEFNIFLQNYCPASPVLSRIKRFFPRSRSVYIIHDFIWLSLFMGDVGGYIKTISGGNDGCDERTIDFLKALYQDCRNAAAIADAVVALNPETGRLLETLFHIPSEKINLIRNGLTDLNPDREEIGKYGSRIKCVSEIPENVHKMLFCGRFTPQKGFDTLIGAMCKVLSHGPDLEFICCGGEYDKLPEDTKMVLDRFEDSIRWAGIVNRGELEKLMAEADAVVFPSRYEQSGYVAIEAKRAGKPLIVSDGFGMADLATGGCALTFESGDMESLSGCIRAFADMTPEEKMELGRLSRTDYEKRYRLDIMKNKYIALFRKISREERRWGNGCDASGMP